MQMTGEAGHFMIVFSGNCLNCRMFRILLFLMTVTVATSAVAQVGITPIKTTEKHADQTIDYKQMGAPMPELRYIKFPDTNYKKVVAPVGIKTDTVAVVAKPKKKRKGDKDIA